MNTLPRRLICLISLILILVTAIPVQAGYPSGASYAAPGSEPSSPRGDTPAPACFSSQIVLIIDQSSSMEKNDTNGLRYYIPLYVAEMLARDYINARMTATRLQAPIKTQLAVVQFRLKAIVGLNWTTIAPENDAAWKEQREEILRNGYLTEDRINERFVPEDNGTSHQAAVDEVSALLQDADTQDETGCPKRTYILLTDGNPDTYGQYLIGDELAQAMKGVQSTVNDQLLANDDNAFYVIGINNPSNTYSFWEATKEYWKAIAHESERTDPDEPERAHKVSTNSQAEIGYHLGQIVSYRLGDSIENVPVGDQLVPPYLDRLILTFYKSKAEDLMQLYDPSGKELVSEPGSVEIQGEEEGIQTIILTRPQPGIYKLATTAKTGDYFITRNKMYIKTDIHSDAVGMYPCKSFPLTINLVDSDGNPIPDYQQEKYRLIVTAEVTSDQHPGEKIPLSLTHDMANRQIKGNFVPVWSGVNHLSITASALDDNGQKLDVLVPPDADFDLLVDPLKLEIGAVQNVKNGSCPPSQYTGFSIPVQLNTTTGNGGPATLDSTIKLIPVGDTFSNLSVVGNNTVTGVSNTSGDQALSITAYCVNPVDAREWELDTQTTTIQVQKGHKYDFAVTAWETTAGRLLTWLNVQRLKLKGLTLPEVWTVGRRFFFIQSDVNLVASFTESGQFVPDAALLPGLQLVSIVDPAKTIPSTSWKPFNAEKWVTSFEKPPLGCYEIKVSSDMPCGAEIYLQPLPQKVCVVGGLSEWIIGLVLVLLALAALICAIIKLLCRFWNPLAGVLVVTNQNRPVWTGDLDGSSCWDFKELPENQACGVGRIKICGVFRSDKHARIQIYQRNATGKLECIKDAPCQVKESDWQDFILSANCRVRWYKSRSVMPR